MGKNISPQIRRRGIAMKQDNRITGSFIYETHGVFQDFCFLFGIPLLGCNHDSSFCFFGDTALLEISF
jgi:hypothetical protein